MHNSLRILPTSKDRLQKLHAAIRSYNLERERIELVRAAVASQYVPSSVFDRAKV